MLTITQNDEKIFTLKDKIIEFTFFKSGQNKGKFSIDFKDLRGVKSSLKNCYACINYFEHESTRLTEYPSYHFSYHTEVQEIQTDRGNGLKIRFTRASPKKDKFDFQFQFIFYDNTDYLLIRLLKIKDLSPNSFKIHSISPLTIREEGLWLSGDQKPTNLKKITWFKNGWTSWSACKLFYGTQKDRKGPPLKILKRTLDNQDYEIKGRFYSEYNTVITDLLSKNALLLGFTTLRDQFSRIILDYKRSDTLILLTAFGCMDGVTLPECSINSSEELFVGFKTDNRSYYGLIDYAKIVEDNTVEERINEVPIGWASWYYYYTKITEEDMIKNLNFFIKNEETIPIDFIQLDDGYFEKIGDYHTINDKFPHGLEWLFEKINNVGFKGGIWTAPFFAEKESEILQEHPKWFLNKKGTDKLLKTHYNWNTFEYSLDLTKSEVLKYIENYFKQFRYALKKNPQEEYNLIEFFKIDFLHAAAPYDAQYSRNDLTRAQLYYNGLNAIRKGISDECFLLGCGAPLGPCVGLVDAMRISTDTAPEWSKLDWIGDKRGFSLPSLKRALINVLYRSYMHTHFWVNDPDCLMIRRTDTKLTMEEIKLQLTVFGLSGGQILISDDMTKLGKKELRDAKLVLPAYNSEDFDPIVSDAFISPLPTVYFLETQESIGKRYLAAIINWDDKPKERSIKISELIPNLLEDEERFYIFDFWNKQFLGEFGRDEDIHLNSIPPHGCIYLSLIYTDEFLKIDPILVSSNLHITQGVYEITDFTFEEEDMTISMIIDLIGKREGELYLKLPPNTHINECRYHCSIFDKENNVVKIDISFVDNTSFTISLGHD